MSNLEEELEKSVREAKQTGSRKRLNLLLVIDKGPGTYRVINNGSENGNSEKLASEMLISEGTNKLLMAQIKSYLNQPCNCCSLKYQVCDPYGFVDVKLTVNEAYRLYENDPFNGQVLVLSGDMPITLKP